MARTQKEAKIVLITQKLEKLNARREELREKLKKIQSRIERLEVQKAQFEQAEILRLIKSKGLSVAQLQTILREQAAPQESEESPDVIS